MRNFYRFICCAGVIVFLAYCNTKPKTGYQEIPANAVRINPVYSKLFAIATYNNDTFLTLFHPNDSSNTLGTWVWGKGKHHSKNIHRIQKIDKIAITSAVFAGMMESLGQQNLLVAVDNVNYISSPKIQKRIAANHILSIAPTGEINREHLAKIKPDLLIAYYIDNKGKSNLDLIQKGGIAVLPFQNFLETHPLGRAEWIKVFGYLCGAPATAMEQFAEIEEHYLSTALRAQELENQPTVLINAPFSGIWDIPAGESYMAALVKDAGGHYIWSASPGTGRFPLGAEEVFLKAQNADVWINPGASKLYSELKNNDKRLAEIKAFQNKNVFNCTKTLNEKGANNYWEYGVLRPDMVLLDLLAIFHPEVEPIHSFVFFEPLK